MGITGVPTSVKLLEADNMLKNMDRVAETFRFKPLKINETRDVPAVNKFREAVLDEFILSGKLDID